jgi:hypothetical protein
MTPAAIAAGNQPLSSERREGKECDLRPRKFPNTSFKVVPFFVSTGNRKIRRHADFNVLDGANGFDAPWSLAAWTEFGHFGRPAKREAVAQIWLVHDVLSVYSAGESLDSF